MHEIPLKLERFEVSAERGFLPPHDPLRRLNPAFRELEDFAAELPELLAAKQVRPTLEKLQLQDACYLWANEYERAHMLATFCISACLLEHWQENKVVPIVPASIARFAVDVSKKTGHPPYLSYVSYALHNWRRIDPKGPIELGNIALMQYFLGGLDEAWFTLVHVAMEAKSGRAILGEIRAQEAVMLRDITACGTNLTVLCGALRQVNDVFRRMPESCNSDIYPIRVRPWIHGTIGNPLMRNGVVYEGVAEYDGKPQQFRGETGAQSSIVPLLDAALGVVHEPSPLSEHLIEMRDYMPPSHRALISAVEARPAIRSFVVEFPALFDIFNACIHEMWEFRKLHYEYAATYIFRHAHLSQKLGNPQAVGTGGTDFMTSLKKHVDETLAAKI